MHKFWCAGLALSMLLTASCGRPLELDEEFCIDSAAVPKKTDFSAAKHMYLFQGACHLARARFDHVSGQPVILPVDAPFSAEGYFEVASGVATEIFKVPEPKITEPSRPWGTFTSSFRCEKDPWLYATTCQPLSVQTNPPLTAYPGPRYQVSRMVLETLLAYIAQVKRPYTAAGVWHGIEKNPNGPLAQAWNSYRQSEQLAQKARQSPGSLHSAGVAPSILRPAVGQVFLTGNPIPIKLGPPVGWTVTGYMIKLEFKGRQGNWVEHRTIPVPAAQAHSAGGYTGFGGGAFPSSPGIWRLSAQVSAPNQSGWSNLIEFKVSTPPPSGALGKGSLMRPQ